MQLSKAMQMVLMLSIFDAFALLFLMYVSNKLPFVGILSKTKSDLLAKKGVFDKIGSLNSLKNGESSLKIAKLAVNNTFSSFVTGTNAIRLITTPVAAHQLQPVFCYRRAVINHKR